MVSLFQGAELEGVHCMYASGSRIVIIMQLVNFLYNKQNYIIMIKQKQMLSQLYLFN